MKRITRFALAFAALLAIVSTTVLAEDAKTRLAKAEAVFQERCKKAGEFIHKTAENVEGILLMKIREGTNFRDQYKMDDPYGDDSTGDEYLKSFFLGPMLEANRYASTENLERIRRDYRGYRFIDALDPKDGQRYRYTGRIEEPWQTNKSYLKGYTRFVLDKTPAPNSAPRYGVTFDDISTREERDYWIAGSSLKVIDLKTNEVIAERIGYMMDRGQGNNSGGRSPWLLASEHACPSFKSSGDSVPAIVYQQRQTQKFVTKVLHPVQEK